MSQIDFEHPNAYDEASNYVSDEVCPGCGNDVTRWTGYMGSMLWHECRDCGETWGVETNA